MKAWHTERGTGITRLLAGRSNVFLLSRGNRHILVDTSPVSRWRKLDCRLRRLGIGRLDALVLTHAHYDHAGSAARLQKEYGAPVIVHRSEAPFLASGEGLVPQGTNFLGRLLIDHFGKSFAARLSCAPCRADILVDGRLDLDGYGFSAYVLHTPGHSPGSMSVIVENEIAVVGDAMFGIFPGSVFPPFAVDAGQLVSSWGRLLDTGCRFFLPSHGSANSRRLVERDFQKRKAGEATARKHAER